jgi:hypothetical protein
VTGRPDDRSRFGVNPSAATGPHLAEEKEAAVMSTESGAVPQRLLDLAKQAAAPQLTERALDKEFGPRSSWVPAAGQLWRAVREDVSALVVVLAVDAESVTVAPATVETQELGTESDAVVLSETVLGVPVTVWPGLRRFLPLNVLDRPIDDLGADVVSRIVESPIAADPERTDWWGDDVRAELADDLDLLAELSADADPAASAEASADAPTGIDLAAVEPDDLNTVASRLGVGLPVVFELIDGKRPATPEQARVFKEVFGGLPTAEPLPTGLVLELRQPRWRGLVRKRSDRDQISEEAARDALTQDVFTLAARQTGEQEPYWPDRIRRWAEGHGLDPDA